MFVLSGEGSSNRSSVSRRNSEEMKLRKCAVLYHSVQNPLTSCLLTVDVKINHLET